MSIGTFHNKSQVEKGKQQYNINATSLQSKQITFIIISFIKLNMDFLRRLFSSLRQPTSSRIQVELPTRPVAKVHHSQLPAGLPHHQNLLTSSSSFQSQFKQSSMLNQIHTKFLYPHQLTKKQLSSSTALGVLVGVIGRQKYYQKIMDTCIVVKLGPSQEINSLRALRKNSLDSLVVFFNQSDSQFELEQIILAEQRLILVVQQQNDLQNLVTKFQKTLCECFEDRSLYQCLSYLCFSVKYQDKRYYLEFKDSKFFLEHFRIFFKKIKVEFQDDSQFLRLIKLIKFKDYLDFRQLKKSAIFKILNLKQEIQREIQNQKKKEEMKKLGSLLSTCENQDYEQEIVPIRKSSSMQAEIEAEYFKKRMSQKRTEEVTHQDQIQSADLFYFIEERDDSMSSDSQSDPYYKKLSKNKIKTDKRKHHSKSQHAVESEKEEDLDQQFFTKY